MRSISRADLRCRVEGVLAGFLAQQRAHMAAIDADLAPLAQAAEQFVLGGGKRLRPAFAYWGYRGAGGAEQAAVWTAISALELVQASALIHDDLMDASDTRRGEPAVHRRFARLHGDRHWHGSAAQFGAAAAILVGDLCLVWSDQLLRGSGMEPGPLHRAHQVFDLMRTEVTLGQYLDVVAQAMADTSPERASQVARFKSAKYTIEHPLLFGAALAGATMPAGDAARLTAAYSEFGLALGEAFQLRDDVLGVFGDPYSTGKPAGDDLREGKRTYLVAVAHAAAGPADQRTLAGLLGDPELDDAAVDSLQEIITRTGALARTEARIGELTSQALAVLAAAPIAAEAAHALRELADAAVHRST